MERRKEFQVRRKAHRPMEEMKGRRTERKEEKEMWHVAEEGPRGGAVEPAVGEISVGRRMGWMGPRQVELQAEEWSEAVGEEAEEEVELEGEEGGFQLRAWGKPCVLPFRVFLFLHNL